MYSEVGPSPPWYVYDAAGQLRVLDVPDRLLKHPELVQRGLASKLGDTLKPVRYNIVPHWSAHTTYNHIQGCVYMAEHDGDPVQVIKILDPNTEEVTIQDRLLREIDRPNNHTLPSEMTVTGHPLLIMPMITRVTPLSAWKRDSLRSFLDIMFQMVEACPISISVIDLCMADWFESRV